MTGLKDKAIAKVNQNQLDWCENFFNTANSVSKNNRLFSDCTFLLEIQNLIWAGMFVLTLLKLFHIQKKAPI